MPRLPKDYRIDGFPKGREIYRIDWYGQLDQFPTKISQPSIDAFLVRYKPEFINQRRLDKRESFDYETSNIQVCKLGFGLFPALPIGTLIRDQTCLDTPGCSRCQFRSVLISEETSSLTDSIENPVDLPVNCHPSMALSPRSK